jgi:hypothetical protein
MYPYFFVDHLVRGRPLSNDARSAVYRCLAKMTRHWRFARYLFSTRQHTLDFPAPTSGVAQLGIAVQATGHGVTVPADREMSRFRMRRSSKY